jgi:hypothetical protein
VAALLHAARAVKGAALLLLRLTQHLWRNVVSGERMAAAAAPLRTIQGRLPGAAGPLARPVKRPCFGLGAEKLIYRIARIQLDHRFVVALSAHA